MRFNVASEEAEVESLFIGFMINRSKGCHNKVIISSMQGVIKRLLRTIAVVPHFISFWPLIIFGANLPPSAISYLKIAWARFCNDFG